MFFHICEIKVNQYDTLVRSKPMDIKTNEGRKSWNFCYYVNSKEIRDDWIKAIQTCLPCVRVVKLKQICFFIVCIYILLENCLKEVVFYFLKSHIWPISDIHVFK